ncbi:MAG: type II secretion system secretin GspD [Oceanococcaceae bacterium]
MISALRQCLLAALIALPFSVFAQNEGGTTLNLKDAEINSLITTVSELTGVNFIVDPRVKGKVTVLSSSPMSPNELYSVFLAVLQVHGFAAVPAGPVVKIVPEVGAKQDGGSYFEYDGLAEDEIVTRVLSIQNVPAAQLVPILRPLVPQYGHLAAYSPSNMLIISDRAANVQRMTEIIRRIDQSTDSELEFIRLKHASAADVQQVIQGLVQGTQAAKQASGQEPLVVLADERTNSILISGDKTQRLNVRGLIAHLDIPLEEDGDTQVIYLSYANAETLAPILEGYAESQTKSGGGGAAQGGGGNAATGDTRIVAEPDTNALVITAAPKIMRGLKSVIAQLDIRRAQVLVEGILAEVSVNQARSLGVDWAVFNEDRIAAASILNSNILSAVSSAISSGTPTAALSALGQGLNVAGGRSNDNGTTFGALLTVLYGDGDTNVLSTPSLVTMDNEEAQISVGQEVPFLTGSFSNTGATGGAVNPFQTIQRQDVGLTLSITPQINEGDSIQLQIKQESSNISAGSAGAVDLVTNKRTLETTVMIDDGDILVLGGLIDDNVQQTEQKIPILGDIPVLGALFRSTSVNKSKQNLMLFIRPTILRDRNTANYYTRRKYNQMRSLQSLARETRLSWGDSGPQLSPLEEMIRPRVLDTLPGGGNAAATPSTPRPTARDDGAPVLDLRDSSPNVSAPVTPPVPEARKPLKLETSPIVYGAEGDDDDAAVRMKMGRGHLR